MCSASRHRSTASVISRTMPRVSELRAFGRLSVIRPSEPFSLTRISDSVMVRNSIVVRGAAPEAAVRPPADHGR